MGLFTHSAQADDAAAQKLWAEVDPARIFARPRIVVSSEHSKAVFVTGEIVRVDFLQESLSCWNFLGGYSDIVELSEEEFQQHTHLDEPALMTKREKLHRSWRPARFLYESSDAGQPIILRHDRASREIAR